MSNHNEAAILALLELNGFLRHGRGSSARTIEMEIGTRKSKRSMEVGRINWNSVTFNPKSTRRAATIPFYTEIVTIGKRLDWMEGIKDAKFDEGLSATLKMQLEGLNFYSEVLNAPAWMSRYKETGRNRILAPFYLMGVDPKITAMMLELSLPAYSPILHALMAKKITVKQVDDYLLLPMGLQSSLLSEV